MNNSTFIYVGGPKDGKIVQNFWMISSELSVADGRVHRYRLRGTPDDPVLSVDGFRILDHCGIVQSPGRCTGELFDNEQTGRDG